MRMFITTLIVAATITTAANAATKKIFEITFEDVPGGSLVCAVAFFGEPPSPSTVDKIVRSALESAVLVDPSRDIVAMGFIGNEAMKGTHYSGTLIYQAKDKRIVTMDEHRGVKKSGNDTGAYFLETREERTLEGIKPERHWLTLTLVYPKAPTVQDAYDAAILEAEKAATSGKDINVYVSVGDKDKPTSWRQLRDSDGGYVKVEYETSSKAIKRRSKVVKKPQ